MSHFDDPFADPEHARTPCMPSKAVSGQAIVDEIRKNNHRFFAPCAAMFTAWRSRDNPFPPELDAKMAGFEDAAHMLVSDDEWARLKCSSNAELGIWHPTDSWWASYAPQCSLVGTTRRYPRGAESAPGGTRSLYGKPGISTCTWKGLRSGGFQIGAVWAKKQDPQHYSCTAFALPARGFALEWADPPQSQDPAFERNHLYMLAFVRGAISGRKLYKELAEQVARGGASAGVASNGDNK